MTPLWYAPDGRPWAAFRRVGNGRALMFMPAGGGHRWTLRPSQVTRAARLFVARSAGLSLLP